MTPQDVTDEMRERAFYDLLNFAGRWAFRLVFLSCIAVIVVLSICWFDPNADSFFWVREKREVGIGSEVFVFSMAQLSLGMSAFFLVPSPVYTRGSEAFTQIFIHSVSGITNIPN